MRICLRLGDWANVSVNEGADVALNITAGLIDTSETLEVHISGVVNATLNHGYVQDGVWILTKAELTGLKIIPNLGRDGADYTLMVKARSKESDTVYADTPEKKLEVYVNRAPTILSQTISVSENVPMSTDVGTVIGDDPDKNDAGDPLHSEKRYYFVGGNLVDGATISGDGLFTIDYITGVVKTVGNLDYETVAQYSYEIEIRDNAAINTNDRKFLKDTATLTIKIDDANEAPVLNISPSVSINTAEDNVSPAGTSVSTLVANGSITDPDGTAVEAIAITSINNTNGTWQFKAGAGVWTNIGAVSVSNALHLDVSDLIRFKPNLNYHGAMNNALEYKAWDKSNGKTAGSYHNANTGGGATAYSVNIQETTLNVSAVNDAPVFRYK